jgi:uncharacterized membrane protein YhaH (DUF805 family)
VREWLAIEGDVAMGGFPFSLFDVGGRLSLGGFWAFYIANLVYLAGVAYVFIYVLPFGSAWWGGALVMAVVASYVVMTFAAIRRLHDLGRSGWWLVLGDMPMVLILGLLVVMFVDQGPGAVYNHPLFLPALIVTIFVLAVATHRPLMDVSFKRGEPGPNRYGPDPLA